VVSTTPRPLYLRERPGTHYDKKVMPPIYFLRNYPCNNNVIYIYHGYILYKADIIFAQSLLHYQHTFYTYARYAVCHSPITVCCFSPPSFAKRRPPKYMLQGAKNVKVGWCFIRTVGRKMRQNSTERCWNWLPCERIGAHSTRLCSTNIRRA
jgi:hypothetical protein